MLTKQDRKYIDEKIDSLAILVQSGFKEIIETKADKSEVATKKDVKDIIRRIDVLEYKVVGSHDRRLDKVEDDIRVIKTKLKIA